MLVSFLGSLPLGTLNVAAMQISITEGVSAAMFFSLGSLLVEIIYVRISLVAMDWIRKQERIFKLGFTIEDFFASEQELMNKVVIHESKNEVKLNGSLTELERMYESFKKQASAVDSTLEKHVEALKLRTVQRLQELEKKMLRAEKRKFTDQQRQINTIKEHLFPGNGLQERYDNISYYYAKWGRKFIQTLYEHSLNLEQEFVMINEK